MPKYSYKAKEGPKKVLEGIVEAVSLDEAVQKVSRLGLVPLDVRILEEKAAKISKEERPFGISSFFVKKVGPSLIVFFTRQMSDLIGAGVPLLQSLTIVEKQTKHQVFKDVLTKMQRIVRDGGSFSFALASFPQVFSKYYLNMIKAGEIGGNLDVVLGRLAEYLEKDQETLQEVKTSLVYPSLIVVVGALTIFSLLTWVVPRITVIFDDLGTSLPFATRVLLGVSDFLSRFWWVFLGGVVGLFYYLNRVKRSVHGRMSLDQMKLKIPFFGDFIREAELGRFARVLGTLLNNGVVVVTSLESAEWVIENVVLKEQIRQVRDEVSNGANLRSALKGKSFFSDAALSMIAVAEESGEMQNGLFRIALFYERRTQQLVKRILTLIEPGLILVLGLVVGFVVMAILMPMFRMNLVIQ